MSNIITVAKMYDALDHGNIRAQPYRKFKEEATQEFVGRFYNKDDGQKRPMNLIARNFTTLLAHLAHRNPKHTVTSDFIQLRGEANVRGILLDEISEELDRIKITRRQLMSAFFGPMAITKIGLRAGDDMVKIDGKHYNPGQAYMQAIDLDDHVCDDARCREEMQWEAHYYRVNRQIATDCGLFDADMIMDLPEADSGEADDGQRTRSDHLSKRGQRKDKDGFDMIELVDVAFYGEGGTVIATLPAVRGSADDYLLVNDFQGPFRGPYEWLAFNDVPNQLYPLPPVAMIREQSELMNKVATKQAEQILRSKRVLAGNRASGDDLKTAEEAEDGQVIEVDEVAGMANFDIGGVMADVEPYIQQVLAFANLQYVNIDIASGQAGGTDKATIYQGMQANLNVLIDDLQNTHEKYEEECSKQLHWYMDTDPLRVRGGTMRVPGGEFLQVVFDPATKRGQFQDFTTKIKYGSMLRQDPQVKAQNLMKLMDMAMQSLPLTIQTGGAWDTSAVLRLCGRYLGIEELDEVIKDPMLQMQLQQQLQSAMTGQSQPGQIAGQSKANPQSIQGARPQPQVGGGFARPQPGGKKPAMAGV